VESAKCQTGKAKFARRFVFVLDRCRPERTEPMILWVSACAMNTSSPVNKVA